jgi:hypothetical protein
MSSKEVIDALLRLLQILVSWPVVLLCLIVVARREVPELISKLAGRMTKAPGGFEFAKLETKVEELTEKVQTLESVAFQPSAALTPELQDHIQSALNSFQAYLSDLGYKPEVDNVGVFVDPTLRDNVYYDGEQRRIVLGEPLARDTDAIFREYSHHVLIPGASMQDLAPEYFAIESALADYFPCSFNDDPLFGEKSVHLFRKYPNFKGKAAIRNLNNDRHFKEAAADPEHHNVGEIWGGAFWELRGRLGKNAADRLLYTTWTGIDPSVRSANVNVDFVKKLMETAPTIGMAEQANDIRVVFRRRGLKV